MWATGGVLEVPLRRIVTPIWPPAVAALVMAAAVFPLLALAVYLGALRVLAPSTVRELRTLPRLARRRGGRRQAATAPAEAGGIVGSTVA